MNKNASIGKNTENLLKKSIKDHPSVIRTIKERFSITGNFMNAFRSGDDHKKIDVLLRFDDGSCLGINMKSFKRFNFGFNQLTRINLKDFCMLFSIPSDISKVLQEGILSIAKKEPGAGLVREHYRQKLFTELRFKAMNIIKWSLFGDDRPELFAVFQQDIGKMFIYDMRIFESLNYMISFSKKGVIQIGDYFSIQRKGGNGNILRYEKTDMRHPGNQLQVKMYLNKFVQGAPCLCSYAT